MPTPKVQQITSWSYSRWKTYEECPAKARYKFILRLPEPQGDAAARGDDIHKKAEQYVMGELKKLPTELQRFKQEFADIRKVKGVAAELSLAYTSKWIACSPTDWKNAWVRIKIDLVTPPDKQGVVFIADNKTGKQRDEYQEQLELYAVAGFLQWPQAERVRGQLWYLDHGVIVPEDPEAGVFERKQLPKLIKLWEKRTTPMLRDTVFAPRAGAYCRWCHFSKSKGGPCKY